MDCGALRLADERSDFRLFRQAVAYAQSLGTIHQKLRELLEYFFMNDQAAGGGAALARGAESSPERAFQGQIKIRIVHHDLRVFSAHFKAAFLERLSAQGAHLSADGT